MTIDRRYWLKLFGLSTAMVPTYGIGPDGKHTDEGLQQVTDPEPVIPVGDERLATWKLRQAQDARFCFDIVTAHLYSALEVGRRRIPHASPIVAPDGQHLDGRLDDAQSEYQLFDYAFGDRKRTGEQATTSDTNLWQRNKLDAPESFVVGSIGILFSPTTRPEVRASFAERYAMELWIGQKCYWRSPVADLFAVGEIEALDRPALGFVKLDVPLLIVDQMFFSVRLQGTPRSSDDLKLWAVLGNLHARGVQ